MDRKEFALIALALQEYYPRDKLLQTKEAKELWFRQLEDIPYKLAEAGVQKWVALNKWSPTIADIREMATSVSLGNTPDWGEAWNEVQVAIRRYGSYRVGDALDSLSKLTRKTTERMGFMNLCMSENVSADRANFRMIYEQLANREKQEAQLPITLKTLIAEVQKDNLMIGERKNDEKD